MERMASDANTSTARSAVGLLVLGFVVVRGLVRLGLLFVLGRRLGRGLLRRGLLHRLRGRLRLGGLFLLRCGLLRRSLFLLGSVVVFVRVRDLVVVRGLLALLGLGQRDAHRRLGVREGGLVEDV